MRNFFPSRHIKLKDINPKMMFTDIIEGSEIAIALSDIDGKVVYTNQEFGTLFGYKTDELGSLCVRKIIHPDDLNLVLKYRENKYKGIQAAPSFAFKGQRKDGSAIYVELVSKVIKRGKKPIGMWCFYNEITERKKQEEARISTIKSLRETTSVVIDVIGKMVESRDPYTGGHQRRVADLSRAIAQEMELPPDRIDGIRIAALIHDIGKISIPAEILSKPSKLNQAEFALIRQHPLYAYEMLEGVKFSWPLAEIVYQHHERNDGSGYPRGLKGDEILLEAKIIAVADVVEAMASHRPYRPSKGINKALEEISKFRGLLYEPAVVDSCLRLFEAHGFEFRIDQNTATSAPSTP